MTIPHHPPTPDARPTELTREEKAAHWGEAERHLLWAVHHADQAGDPTVLRDVFLSGMLWDLLGRWDQ